jgi:hypothetical protein
LAADGAHSSSDSAADGGPSHKTAKLNLWSAVAAAAVTGVLSAVTAYIAKPAPEQKPPVVVTAAPSTSANRPAIRLDPVAAPVGLCNVFNGTGDWDSATTDLLLFNRPWDNRNKVGTGNFYLDGRATKLPQGTWKGPQQEIGRDTKEGFAVEISAVVVSRAWAAFLLGDVTGPDDQYWAARKLPPHEAVATLVVTRDGITPAGC